MCGIVAVISQGADSDALKARLAMLADVQIHRGPDGQGVHVEALTGGRLLGLGVQRLSILDRTPAASQPMVSADGRYVLAYNGEVYNYRELAAALGDDPILTRSSGDTAVVMAALARWGTDALPRFNGMWALAFLDRERRTMLVSRDRAGVKPLYYADNGAEIMMGSEIKTVLAARPAKAVFNGQAIGRFLIQSIADADGETFFDGVHVFPPASVAVVDLAAGHPSIAPRRYWHHPFEIDGGETGTAGDPPTVTQLRDTFISAVDLHMRSDVDVGVLVSGGIDSSAILAAVRELGKLDKVRGIAVVSNDAATSEEQYIDLVVNHFGVACEKLRIDDNPQILFDDIGEAGRFLDQPLFSLAQAAHRRAIGHARGLGLTVLLSGQGADEQLAGYRKFRFFQAREMLRKGQVPQVAFNLTRDLLTGQLADAFNWNEAKRYVTPWIRSGAGRRLLGPALADVNLIHTGFAGSFAEREYRDMTKTSLPMLLQSEDRMSMSHSSELRVPFLDYRLMEMFARMPATDKLKGGWTKSAFRRAIEPYLPAPIVWRKRKGGYAIPEDNWARTLFRYQYGALFAGPMLAESQGLIDQQAAREKYGAFLEGRRGATYKEVFACASLELWLRRMDLP